MAIPRKKVRGLESIRTLSGRADPAFQPYRAHLKIASLEMEKARRHKEKESAMLRVGVIDARTEEIEAEKTEILHELGLAGDADAGEPGSPSEKGGFKIRY